MQNQEFYIKKWLDGTLTEAERMEFEQSPEFKKVKKMERAMASLKAPDYNVEAGFSQLTSKLAEKKGKVRPMRANYAPPSGAGGWLSLLLKIAAVLVVAIGGYFLFSNENPVATEIATLASQKSEITLPDFSTVSLNASSRISYFKNDWDENRKVTLDGEAFFKVAKGSRFDVVTNTGTVSVLGTQFNVKNRKGYFEVTCYEGLVKVLANGHTAELPAKKVFRIINGVVANEEELYAAVPSWMLDESSFRSVPFVQVIREFERQYNVTVVAENIDTLQLFSGKFSNTDLSLALKSIANPFNLASQINGKEIVLRGENK
jgi:transmembrane sensor